MVGNVGRTRRLEPLPVAPSSPLDSPALLKAPPSTPNQGASRPKIRRDDPRANSHYGAVDATYGTREQRVGARRRPAPERERSLRLAYGQNPPGRSLGRQAKEGPPTSSASATALLLDVS